MAADSRSPWSSATRLAIGRVLLGAGSEGLTAADIGDSIEKHQSNVKKLAEELVSAGVLQLAEPVATNGRRGRPATVAFEFATGERERFEELLDIEGSKARLEVNQQLVLLNPEEDMDLISEVLSQPGVVSGAVWHAFIAGDPPILLVAFNGSNATQSSRDLMAVLKQAKLNARRGSVSSVGSGRELARAEARKQKLVDRSRARIQSRRANSQSRE